MARINLPPPGPDVHLALMLGLQQELLDYKTNLVDAPHQPYAYRLVVYYHHDTDWAEVYTYPEHVRVARCVGTVATGRNDGPGGRVKLPEPPLSHWDYEWEDPNVVDAVLAKIRELVPRERS